MRGHVPVAQKSPLRLGRSGGVAWRDWSESAQSKPRQCGRHEYEAAMISWKFATKGRTKLFSRPVVAAAAAILLLAWSLAAQVAAQSASADDYRQEAAVIAAVAGPQLTDALAGVRRARAVSGLSSTLPEGELDQRLARLVRWEVEDYANSASLRLLSALPDGRDAAGESNARLRALQHTYWLQDNSLYGAAALNEYVPVVGRILTDEWHKKWIQAFPDLCRDTQSVVVIGRLPDYDTGGTSSDPRCHLPRPGAWEFYRMHQYPDPHDASFDTLPKPIIGTDHPVDPQLRTHMAAITQDSPRNLLKYGCLRQVLLGNGAVAKQMFDLALGRWDGNGFIVPKNDPQSGGRLAGIYWTRDLAFALLCANALGEGGQQAWGDQGRVTKASIENRLWRAQSDAGGMWTNTCGDPPNPNRWCNNGAKLPSIAKQTNEIAPLVLLAYGPNLWKLKP
jgi:hypothetical protein